MTAAGESFALLPMTAVTDPRELEAWFAGAAADDRALVAEGRVKPVSALGWVLAEQWRRLQLVEIVGEAHGRGWRWFAVRRGAGAAGGGHEPTLPRDAREREPEAPDGTAVSDCIHRRIRMAANMGLPAPSLAMLAKAAGLNAPAGAKYWLDKLVRRGLVELEIKRMAGGERRRFHILNDGVRVKSSGWSRPAAQPGAMA